LNKLPKKNPPNPQTLEFAYFEGQKILSHHLSISNTLDTKIIAIFSVATIVIGVVPPLIYSGLNLQNTSLFNDWRTLLFLVLAGICYLTIFGFSLKSCWTKSFGLVPRLKFVYNNIHESPDNLREKIVNKYVLKAYKRNVANLRIKALTLKIVIIATGLETVFMLTLLTLVYLQS